MRIGTLAHAAGVTTKTIRFYERSGLLPEPPRTPSGYRDYPPESAERLEFIRGAQSAGLSLAEIRLLLRVRDEGTEHDPAAARLLTSQLRRIDDRILELTRTRDALRALLPRLASPAPPDPLAPPDPREPSAPPEPEHAPRPRGPAPRARRVSS
ncbi:heavy metal-responsive transcriptional regulator [Streptomyces sp. 4N509B]|uniref:heavy metal-responsive transcriptional regulator n=1 Tax=Streptomyces sp. 4N509B TaxID=3457413 RepID=UPI003FD1259A